MNDRRISAVILAAGDGKRMQSDRPKVLCEVLMQPMLRWVEDACRAAGVTEVNIVAGRDPDSLRAVVTPDCRFYIQSERLGTGHAAKMAADAYVGGGDVLICYGDAPLLTPEIIAGALAQHRAQDDAVTLVSTVVSDPTGYGRILRGEGGDVRGIVEQRDANDAQRAICEINAGVYWFDAGFLQDALSRLTPQNEQGEYYLTDTVALAVADGLSVGGYRSDDPDALRGANDRRQLRDLNAIARRRQLDRCLDAGADIPCEDGVIIGAQVRIGRDAQILPGTLLLGETRIGAGCVIGPNSRIDNCTIGAGSRIIASFLCDSTVGEQATVGPFSQLRPNSHIGDRAKLGDFVEIKNATIGEGTSVAHLTYIGDSDVGRFCNFGCGVVTANYDGKKKYRTVIADRAFIGCNTNLIPPVRVGEGAYTAAGTTITKDVPDGALAIGRVRQEIHEHWSDEHIGFKK